MKRIKKFAVFLLAVTTLLGLSGCRSNKPKRYEAEFITLFDTVTKIISYGGSKEEFSRQCQMIYDELETYHQLYDIYNSYEGINNLKTVNDNAGKAPVTVDKKIIDLLLFAKEMHEVTQGKMNVALGSVLEIWHDYRTSGINDPENAAVPPAEQLENAAKHTDINRVIIDAEASTVFLQDKEMRLDVGSVGKGYATEQVCKSAQSRGVESMLVSVGGNVRAIGAKGENTPWEVGVQNPDKESDKTLLYHIRVTDTSLVTSGDYERYYTVAGKRYHHIIDPESLMPAEYFTAVAVLTADSGLADCLTTALFTMSYEQGVRLLEAFPDTEALWISHDGTRQFSPNFKTYIAA